MGACLVHDLRHSKSGITLEIIKFLLNSTIIKTTFEE